MVASNRSPTGGLRISANVHDIRVRVRSGRSLTTVAVADLLDPASVELRRDSFVDPDLREHFSDLLYEVGLRDGQDAFVYVLLEHKSYPDRWVALQLLRYLVRIWEQERRRTRRRTLVPIQPVVLYYGRRAWDVPERFAPLVVAPAAPQVFQPDFAYHVDDVSALSAERIVGTIGLRVALLTMQAVKGDAFPERLLRAVELLAAVANRQTVVEMLEVVLRYASLARPETTQDVARGVPPPAAPASPWATPSPDGTCLSADARRCA